MLHIVLAGKEHDVLAEFGTELHQADEVDIRQVDSAAAALNLIKERCVDLVVVGQSLTDTTPIDCVMQLIREKPMVNCAMLSAMDRDAFHEATEGLGILMQLQPKPCSEEAVVLLSKIELLSSLLSNGAEN